MSDARNKRLPSRGGLAMLPTVSPVTEEPPQR